MSLRDMTRRLKGFSAGLAVLLSLQSTLFAQECCGPGGCGGATPMASTHCHCHRIHCPKYCFCLKGAPCIKFKYGCALPICEPCSLPHWGYYQPCWRPWPYPPDWSHCPYPVPAAAIAPCPQGPQAAVAPTTAPTTGPAPRLLPSRPGM